MKHFAFQLIALWILQRQYFLSECSHTFGQEFVRHQSCFVKTLPRLSFCISHFYTPQSTRSRKESAFEEKQKQRIDVEKGNLKSCFSWLWTLLAQLWRWVQLCSTRVCSVWEESTKLQVHPGTPETFHSQAFPLQSELWHYWDLISQASQDKTVV